MIKPEFFDDPDIADLSPLARLCFIGLWVQADKAGLLIDDPRRLKVRLFPYDDVDVAALIDELAAKRMVLRYSVDTKAYLSVVKFLKHQRPHPKEPASTLPPVPVVKKNGEPCKNPAEPSESGVLILESGVLSSEARTRAAASPRPRPVENPHENVRVITRLVHDACREWNDFADVKESVKTACAFHRIAYDSDVVGKAIESAMKQRRVS